MSSIYLYNFIKKCPFAYYANIIISLLLLSSSGALQVTRCYSPMHGWICKVLKNFLSDLSFRLVTFRGLLVTQQTGHLSNLLHWRYTQQQIYRSPDNYSSCFFWLQLLFFLYFSFCLSNKITFSPWCFPSSLSAHLIFLIAHSRITLLF